MFEDLMLKIWKYTIDLRRASINLPFDPNDEYFSQNCFLKETLKRLRVILESVENLNKDLPKAIAELEKEVERRVNNGKTS